jgi:hypothetical protein
MIVCLHSGGMVTIFPESSFPSLSPVVVLCHPARNELHRPRDHFFTPVGNKQVYMIRSNHVVQHAQSIPLLHLEQPPYPHLSITSKFEQKFPLVTPVGDMPNVVSRQILSISPCHVVRHLPARFSMDALLKGHFRYKKISF